MPDMDKIIKDNAIRGLQNVIEISGALVHLRKEYAKVILELLKEQEVVRCKDCKKQGSYDCHITSLTGQTSSDDWFCADWTRKDS